MKLRINNQRGFTLIELLVVIAIIGVLSSIVIVSLNKSRFKALDSKRISSMREMTKALALYFLDYNVYPNSDYAGYGGWDTPGNGTFIAPLVSNGYLPENILDPTTNNFFGNYRYYRYPAGNAGCPVARGAYYVLGIVNLQSVNGNYPTSPGWSCPNRNWQNEFEWVTGQFEN